MNTPFDDNPVFSAQLSAQLAANKSSIGGSNTKSRGSGVHRMRTAAERVQTFEPPDYSVKGMMIHGRILTLTGHPGAAKTAISIFMSGQFTYGGHIGQYKTRQGSVIYLAAENPDDVDARFMALGFHNKKVDLNKIHIIDGTFDLVADMENIKQKITEIGDVRAVFIDTYAAFFDGEDEDKAGQGLKFMQNLRELTLMERAPTVVILAHPPKSAGRNELRIRGSGAVHGESDGNICVWQSAPGVSEVFRDGKYRGPAFNPMTFEMASVGHPRLVDSDGEPMLTVLADIVSSERQQAEQEDTISARDLMLIALAKKPHMNAEQLARAAGIETTNARKKLTQMTNEKMIERTRTKKPYQYACLAKGKKWASAYITDENLGEELDENDD